MKPMFWTLGTLCAIAVAVGAYVFGPFEAPWVEFGYYGQFNQVQRIIRERPELKIEDRWQHRDLIMEDFSFSVAHRDGSKIRIAFWENSPQRKLARDDDIRESIKVEVEARKREAGK
jgi:hypothetical protein